MLKGNFNSSFDTAHFSSIIDRKSKNYYGTTIKKWSDSNRKLKLTKLSWEAQQADFSLFIYGLGGSMFKIIDLYISVQQNDGKNLDSKINRFSRYFKQICSIKKTIRLNFIQGEEEIAKEQVEFSFQLFQSFFDTLNQDFKINLQKTSLYCDIEKNIKKFELDGLKFKFQQHVPNPYPEIFENSTGFQIFEKLHESFKGGKFIRADFSFIFYALKKDNFIDCQNIEFIEFLLINYKIDLDKIDSRQIGENKRTPVYQSIKSSFF